ncbi:glycine cleavage system protein GcvH [Coralliovum pocilloporae]|uniref:glycine cleavage system protein GcvH n=1 Tax=Coralliovum pocilloporae TaxID=3066369 RepID=UPI003307B31B
MAIYYSEEHEWVRVEGDTATVGITKHAADQLGDIVFVEVNEAGEEFDKGDEIGTIESVKAASEIYAPVAGEILEVNGTLEDAPASLNEDPEGGAWLCKIKVSESAELDELMDADAYKAFIADA